MGRMAAHVGRGNFWRGAGWFDVELDGAGDNLFFSGVDDRVFFESRTQFSGELATGRRSAHAGRVISDGGNFHLRAGLAGPGAVGRGVRSAFPDRLGLSVGRADVSSENFPGVVRQKKSIRVAKKIVNPAMSRFRFSRPGFYFSLPA